MATRDLVYVALFAAIIAVLGLLPPVPVPVIGVPITAQTLGVMLAGSVLGGIRGGLSVVLFLVLVAAGAPLLAGGRGGFGVFLGPSGGFLVAWPIVAVLIGWTVERMWSRLSFWSLLSVHLVFGVGVMYAIGVPWTATVTRVPIEVAFLGALWFLGGDIVKAAIAAYVALTVKRAYPLITPRAVRTASRAASSRSR